MEQKCPGNSLSLNFSHQIILLCECHLNHMLQLYVAGPEKRSPPFCQSTCVENHTSTACGNAGLCASTSPAFEAVPSSLHSHSQLAKFLKTVVPNTENFFVDFKFKCNWVLSFLQGTPKQPTDCSPYTQPNPNIADVHPSRYPGWLYKPSSATDLNPLEG